MSDKGQKVAIITGGSQGIGASLVTAYRRQGWSVNISATIADFANSSVPSVLAALTKGGLASATRSLAVEYASRGIRVNAVSPGIIQTPMHPADSYEELGDRLPPLGRVGQVSDVVDRLTDRLQPGPVPAGRQPGQHPFHRHRFEHLLADHPRPTRRQDSGGGPPPQLRRLPGQPPPGT